MGTTYQFDTHQLTYYYRWLASDRWRLRVGVTGLVRNAEVRLRQGGIVARDTDVGFVPLLHLAGSYRLDERWRLAVRSGWFCGAPGPCIRRGGAPSPPWDTFVGYRTLDGRVDNDDIYNFAHFDYAIVGASYRF